MFPALLLILFAAIGLAQDDSAVALIEGVAKLATQSATWRIEGTVSYTGVNRPGTAQFTLIARSPNQLRFEQRGGPTPAMLVCDGTTAWMYSPPLALYSKSAPANSPDCSLILASWRTLPTTLISPTRSGGCGADPMVASNQYSLIQAVSKPDPPIKGQIKHDLCIDPSRKIIVWERIELGSWDQLYVYQKVDRDVEMPSDAFQFDPPKDAELIDVELPIPRPFGSRGPLSGQPSTPPVLRKKKEPVYDEPSRRAKIAGTAVLWAVIGVDGVPTHIRVFQSLAPGLDAAAIKALNAWRFAPGKLNGVEHVVPVTVDMNFRLK